MIYYTFLIILLAGAVFCAWQISVADFRRRIIPDAYLFPLLLIGLLLVNFSPIWVCGPRMSAIGAAFGYGLASIVGFIFDWLRHRHSPDAPSPIGMGDIKLLGVGGLYLGPSSLAGALVLACLFGGTWAKIKKQTFIPFAPFFIAGAILSLIGTFFLL